MAPTGHLDLPTDPAIASPVGASLAEFTRLVALELAAERIELPSFPEVALRVRKALADEHVPLEDVVRIVSVEPSLAVRLLQLANSVALNPGAQRVTTLRTAIARIGFNLARSATIAFAMSQMRRAESWRGLEVRFRQLWDASAQLAAMSHAVARRFTDIDADQALLAGMLHAVGKLFVLTRLSRFPALLADTRMYLEIENVWHARAARALLANWDLEPEIIDAACDFDAAAHSATLPVTAAASLGDVLFAAHHLAQVRELGDLAQPSWLMAPAFQRLRLDAHGCAEVLDASANEVASLRAALGD
jgi:HD-like signal output (HDOD) protein